MPFIYRRVDMVIVLDYPAGLCLIRGQLRQYVVKTVFTATTLSRTTPVASDGLQMQLSPLLVKSLVHYVNE